MLMRCCCYACMYGLGNSLAYITSPLEKFRYSASERGLVSSKIMFQIWSPKIKLWLRHRDYRLGFVFVCVLITEFLSINLVQSAIPVSAFASTAGLRIYVQCRFYTVRLITKRAYAAYTEAYYYNSCVQYNRTDGFAVWSQPKSVHASSWIYERGEWATVPSYYISTFTTHLFGYLF